MKRDVTVEMLRRLCEENVGTEGKVKTTQPTWLSTAGGTAQVLLTNPLFWPRTPTPETEDEIARLRSALAVLNPDVPRGNGALLEPGSAALRKDVWLLVIWAICSLNWRCGKEIAREWSEQSSRYTDDGFEAAWKGYKPNHPNPIGIGTLYALAKQHGRNQTGTDATASILDSHGDVRNARAFAGLNRGLMLYVSTRDRWLQWIEGQWCRCEKGEEYAVGKDVCGKILAAASAIFATDQERGKHLLKDAVAAHNMQRITAMLKLAQSEPGMATTDRELDSDPYLLGVANGVIDLRSGQLLPNRPELMITRYCAAAYDSDPKCDRWISFLDQIFLSDAESIDAVQVLLGCTLLGVTGEEILIICFGFGSNGKSVFSNVVQKILGDYAVTAPPSLLTARTKGETGPRNDIAAMAGSRLVSINELQAGDRLDEQVVKSLAGREPISARFLHQEFFEFQPTFTPWLRTNHKPIITGEDDGIWRRLVLIPFAKKFSESEQDPHLEGKLLDERNAILMWMVEGARRYLADGLRLSPRMKAEVASYRKDSDLMGEFFADCTRIGPDYKIEQTPLFERWKNWRITNNYRPTSKKTFTQRLAERGFKESKSGDKRYYVGLE
jgi:putative DNA primase/helicase